MLQAVPDQAGQEEEQQDEKEADVSKNPWARVTSLMIFILFFFTISLFKSNWTTLGSLLMMSKSKLGWTSCNGVDHVNSELVPSAWSDWRRPSQGILILFVIIFHCHSPSSPWPKPLRIINLQMLAHSLTDYNRIVRMPVSKAALGRSYIAEHDFPSASPSFLGNLLPHDVKKEKTISLSTIIIIAIVIVFGVNAISQF